MSMQVDGGAVDEDVDVAIIGGGVNGTGRRRVTSRSAGSRSR